MERIVLYPDQLYEVGKDIPIGYYYVFEKSTTKEI